MKKYFIITICSILVNIAIFGGLATVFNHSVRVTYGQVDGE